MLVINKWPSYMLNLWFQDEHHTTVEDRNSVSPAYRQASQPHSTHRGLGSSEVARGDVEGAMVIPHKRV
jgi:hypothetical protein